MNEYKFNIMVKTDKVLTIEEKDRILRDFNARLEGYHTICPEALIDAEINLTREMSNDEITKALLNLK